MIHIRGCSGCCFSKRPQGQPLIARWRKTVTNSDIADNWHHFALSTELHILVPLSRPATRRRTRRGCPDARARPLWTLPPRRVADDDVAVRKGESQGARRTDGLSRHPSLSFATTSCPSGAALRQAAARFNGEEDEETQRESESCEERSGRLQRAAEERREERCSRASVDEEEGATET